MYSSIPGHGNWQMEIAVLNLAGFLLCALETRWQRCGQFLNSFLNDCLNDFLCKNLNFLCENHNFLYENPRFSQRKILIIFFMIYVLIHKISYYKVGVCKKLAVWGGSFIMV